MPRRSKWKRVPADNDDSDDDEPVDKVTEVQRAIEMSKSEVQRAINKTIERGDKLDDLEDKADTLQTEAQIFQRQARNVHRRMCW
eukprot:CAMPEP_0202712518 /NCGR_PEP_ID=MMETSP1385-20130828/42094_1 /ASSEMBLY_ACC=CAM_ASM_000861 /TAXON_ID=933848 /ORGANISM="Elphidium margaritaceum" /LENGTH=84 /DNA_ID=CAMNT_0049372589 /DNA_START=122 /DNA_END=373 /DNA_ORIENTATION=+